MRLVLHCTDFAGARKPSVKDSNVCLKADTAFAVCGQRQFACRIVEALQQLGDDSCPTCKPRLVSSTISFLCCVTLRGGPGALSSGVILLYQQAILTAIISAYLFPSTGIEVAPDVGLAACVTDR